MHYHMDIKTRMYDTAFVILLCQLAAPTEQLGSILVHNSTIKASRQSVVQTTKGPVFEKCIQAIAHCATSPSDTVQHYVHLTFEGTFGISRWCSDQGPPFCGCSFVGWLVGWLIGWLVGGFLVD